MNLCHFIFFWWTLLINVIITRGLIRCINQTKPLTILRLAQTDLTISLTWAYRHTFSGFVKVWLFLNEYKCKELLYLSLNSIIIKPVLFYFNELFISYFFKQQKKLKPCRTLFWACDVVLGLDEPHFRIFHWALHCKFDWLLRPPLKRCFIIFCITLT